MKITNLAENTPGTTDCVPQHGLSLHIETPRHKILFDAGPSEETLENARKLGIDLRKTDIAVLSHGHYDHSGGFAAFAALNPSADIWMQRTASEDHYARDEDENTCRYIGIGKELPKLPGVRFADGDVRIDDELSLFTVEKRLHAPPDTNSRILKLTDEGYVPDDFTHEQCLLVRANGSSAMFSGCAHSGILNILEEFRRKFPGEPFPGTVISGFHLMRRNGYTERDFSEHEKLAEKLMAYPCVFRTCHCTGTEPYERMKRIMKDRLTYIRVGETVTA